MGAQSILGTPLFSADVFQWARFRNVIDRQKLVVKQQKPLIRSVVSSAKKQFRGCKKTVPRLPKTGFEMDKNWFQGGQKPALRLA